MKYDFDKTINRRNTNSYKWNVAKNELPLWVADMDFETAPCVKDAITKRALHGVFGYTEISSEWTESYKYWWKKRHSLEIKSDWLIFCTGIVPAISTCVRKLTTPAEKVLIQTPVYNIFFKSIENNGRFVVESPLDYEKETGTYKMNFTQLEKDLSDPQISLMILCNPHNPCGNIWKKEELQKIGELCYKYDVKVISDEIHCDIVKPGNTYIPFASVSQTCRDISVTCIAPTKCFNLAGINSAAVVIPNEFLRHKVWRALNTDEVAEPNAFAVDATVAAFTNGEDWLNQLNTYLWENRQISEEFISKKLSKYKLKVIKAEATYLLWVDVSETGLNGECFSEKLRKQTGLYISSGIQYGKTGENFIRINLACPKSVLIEALERLESFLNSLNMNF